MAEMFCSALVQEAVSRGVSFGLGKREEKASQGHIMERLEMAAMELEFALERSAKLPITEVSLLRKRKMIKCAYVEAAELLAKHKQQQIVQGAYHEKNQGVKRKGWIIPAKRLPTAVLNADDVRRLEWSADRAGKFVRDVETGCSLRHYTFCNPLVRHLLEGKTLCGSMEQGNRLGYFYIKPMCSEERGVEVFLFSRYDDKTVVEKSFEVLFIIRLSESTDISGLAIRCLRLVASQFKLEAESAVGEFGRLVNSQDISHSYVLPSVGIQEFHIEHSPLCRPEPACCEASRHGRPCADNFVSSELSHIFPEQVIFFGFNCYISAQEYRLRSLSNEAGRNVSRGWRSPLEVSVGIMPHLILGNDNGCFALERIGNNDERKGASLQQVAETVRSNATNCFFRQPELTDYQMYWHSNHGAAWFVVKKPSTEKLGAPKTSGRSNNTPRSTKRRR